MAHLIIFHHLHIKAHGFNRGHVPELIPALPFGALHNIPAPWLRLCAGPNRGLLVQGIQDEPKLIWNGLATCMGCMRCESETTCPYQCSKQELLLFEWPGCSNYTLQANKHAVKQQEGQCTPGVLFTMKFTAAWNRSGYGNVHAWTLPDA